MPKKQIAIRRSKHDWQISLEKYLDNKMNNILNRKSYQS